jgi:hypothetical protein
VIFKSSDSPSQRVQKAKSHYESALSKKTGERKSMDKAFAFRHGNQWTKSEKAELEEQGRPALTFNLVAPIVREMIGANDDQRREPRAAPVGAEDLPTSIAINHLCQRVYKMADGEMAESKAFEHMVTVGTGFVFMDANVSERNPNEIDATYDAVNPREVVVDPESCGTNCDDASFFWWSRWLSEADFKSHYPEEADMYEKLAADMSDSPGSWAPSEFEATVATEFFIDGMNDSAYFSRESHSIRVLHCEYQVADRRYYVYDPRPSSSGEPTGYVRVKKKTYNASKAAGAQVHSSVGKKWMWFECTGAQVLFDGEQPLPIYCSQLHAVTCYHDETKNEYYGLVKDLLDPQQEFNKRTSQEMNLVNQSAQPGMIYDSGAFPGKTENEVERTVKRPGFVLERAMGKTHEFREAPQVPMGADRLAERASLLIQTISGVDTNPMLGGQPDQVAVGTAMLAHRKGLQSISTILKNFRAFQKKLLSSTIELVMQGFGDEQIEEMLGDSEQLKVENGVIYDAEKKTQVQLRELRSVRWNIEMDTAAANTTQQMMMFTLLNSLQATTPIDPDVLWSYFPGSREEQQKLSNYAKEAQAAQAQAAQAAQQQSQAQVENVVKIEAMKVQQRSQEAQLDASVTQEGQKLDLLAAMVKLFVDTGTEAGAQKAKSIELAIEQAKLQIAGFSAGAKVSNDARYADIDARSAESPAAA